MIALVLITQVALPLALLLWLALAPAGSVSGFALQAAGTGAFLFALARVAQWALPVWWLPWVYAGFWLAAVVAWPLRKNVSGLPLLPAGLWGWSGLALSLVLLGVGGWLGEVGNSGASTEPHLHIHAQRPVPDGAPTISGDPLALRIEGRFLVRGDHLTGRDG
ncbi:hypothetical protein KG088_17565 [Halomonas sp. TRM85114]|uniref:hypothetical protein n=1 Tax=Halomonas jincaotanensis TaxID=2810616 RepID=UPI001BD5F731|nr:hypothetical protein [Halomonas jincaotanensis]MBS9405419.1 hypothetical protein [Halomonas jincaotanensis]